MDVRLTWTDCDEAGDYVVSNVLSPRDLVSRPDKMDETVLHTLLLLDKHVILFSNCFIVTALMFVLLSFLCFLCCRMV